MLERRTLLLGILAGAGAGVIVEYGRILWFEHRLRNPSPNSRGRSGTFWLN